jgi:rod shape-determining protein MreB
MLENIWRIFTHDIAIDLGTANTLVAVGGHGIVINEPSVVAVNQKTNEVLAVGAEAKQMLGRTPASVIAVRPLRQGVISDFDTAEAMIRYFIQNTTRNYGHSFKINKPRVVIGVPSLITEVEAMAVIDAAKSAGARKVYIIEEPIAAAVGAGLPIEDAVGNMIVDIGGGTTDIAIISLGGVVVDKTLKTAGDAMDEAIVAYAKHKYNLLIGERMAEEVKLKIGSLFPLRKEEKAGVSGRDIASGLPKTVEFSSIEIREALDPVASKVASAAQRALEQAPAEIVADIAQRGITLVGGGALISGADKYFASKLKVPVVVSAEPMHAVVKGAYALLDQIALLEKIQVTDPAFV